MIIIKILRTMLTSIINNKIVNKTINNKIINIILYILFGILMYLFFGDLKIFNTFQIFISSLISLSISLFISDKFKFSNNKFIKILQKFIFINSIFVLIVLILSFFEFFSFSTISYDDDDEKILDNKINNKEKISQDSIGTEVSRVNELGTNIVIGVVAGKIAAEVWKITNGISPILRIIWIGVSIFIMAAAIKIGLQPGKFLTEVGRINNFKFNNEKKSSTDDRLINTILDENEIPLINMVTGLCILNYLEFSLILSLFSLLFRKYLFRILKPLIFNFINKYIKNKQNPIIKDDNINLHKIINNVDNYTDYLILFVFICLLWIKFINLYYSNQLIEHLDSFVNVYVYLKNKK